MEEWAQALRLEQSEIVRWRRTGLLHDCLRDAPPDQLRSEVPAQFRDLSNAVLHGPAAAERLAGSIDPEMADAIRYHTLGFAGWERLGCALYLADYLEPGRRWDPEGRAALRARVPVEFDIVLREVVAERLGRLISQGKPVRAESVAFWNGLVESR
jgi:2-amino-4-hydroxy-6-hydroxymethyldihydropteridine diphosphokinase